MAGSAQPQAGYRFELRVLALLRREGYWAMRSPASKSPIDIVAIKPGQVLFVQCKVDGRLYPVPWNELVDAARLAGAVPLLAERPSPRVVLWWRLTGRKGIGIRFQPREPFLLDEAALDGVAT